MADEATAEVKLRRALSTLAPEEIADISDWVAIPNIPDASPYVLGLQMRIGTERVARASRIVNVIRVGLNMNYGEVQRLLQTELHVTPLA